MLRRITLARSWHLLVRIGIATIAVAVATIWRLPGEMFLLYFVSVVASASVLGRTAGFVAVAESTIASLFLFDRVYSPKVYCRLKDFRRIATRYDKLARNFFSSVCLVAAVAYWL
jgi:hypothetical protein